jgi:pyrroloquinoline quinone biosynthesis protein D
MSSAMQANSIPTPRRGFQLEEMGEENLLYRHSAKRVVYLNASAAVIWRLCDGKRTIAAIETLLTENYPEAVAEISADVRRTIEMLMREGALRLTSAVGGD